MSFRLGRFFYLTISFVVGTFLSLIGIFGLILPWSSFLQETTIQFILTNPLILSLFGLGFVLMGVSLFIYTYLQTRHHYVHLTINGQKVSLDEEMIHQSLEIYWKEHFPQTIIPFTMAFKKHHIEVVADLPSFSLPEQKLFLEKINQDFSHLFEHVLGYSHEVRFTANFRPS